MVDVTHDVDSRRLLRHVHVYDGDYTDPFRRYRRRLGSAFAGTLLEWSTERRTISVIIQHPGNGSEAKYFVCLPGKIHKFKVRRCLKCEGRAGSRAQHVESSVESNCQCWGVRIENETQRGKRRLDETSEVT